jgi:nucleotide-binding universal stress UspA family protein
MKTLLLPYFDDDVSQRAFELSAQIMRPVNGYVEGLFVARRPPLVDADTSALESQFALYEEDYKRLALQAQTRFEANAAHGGIAIETISASGSGGRLTAGWREIAGVEGQVVGSHGRLFDLIVVGRDFGHPWLSWLEIVESALFESGRPVLLTPKKLGATFGERVVIAWNSSTETARTIAFAMPLLARAQKVTIVSVEGWGVPGPSAEQLANYLGRAGISATARTVAPGKRTAGVAILDECASSDADLLLKGAYTQSRLRQMIFGGATRHILAQAQIPVFFAN